MKQKMKNQSITKSVLQTKKLAEKLAEEILKLKSGKKAIVLALEGDLGGGKTTFIQGFARGLGIKEKILSPTFVLMKHFQFNNLAIKQFNNFYHLDCYRIQEPKELLDLGFKEIFSNPQNIIAIEWADRVKKIIPKDAIFIKFNFIDKKTRKITIQNIDRLLCL